MFDVCIGSTDSVYNSDSKIAEYGRSLLNALKSRGSSVWYGNDDIPIGSLIEAEIEETIDKSRVCVIILSDQDKWLLRLGSKLTAYIEKRRQLGYEIGLMYLILDTEGISKFEKMEKYHFNFKDNSWFCIPEQYNMEFMADRIIRTFG